MFAKLLTCGLVLGLATPALADRLPKGAKPMTPEAITQLYAGKTADWGTANAYFAPDGLYTSVYKVDNGAGIVWGRWQVKGNQICTSQIEGFDTISNEGWKGEGNCWKWWVDAEGQPITLWSKRFDGSKPDIRNDYYRDEIGKLKKGDKVSARFNKVYAKVKN